MHVILQRRLASYRVIDIEVTSIKDLVGEVLSLRGKRPKASYLWFRGLNCKTHSLLPKLMRDSKFEQEVFEREKRLLTRFRQRSIGVTPIQWTVFTMLQAELS